MGWRGNLVIHVNIVEDVVEMVRLLLILIHAKSRWLTLMLIMIVESLSPTYCVLLVDKLPVALPESFLKLAINLILLDVIFLLEYLRTTAPKAVFINSIWFKYYGVIRVLPIILWITLHLWLGLIDRHEFNEFFYLVLR